MGRYIKWKNNYIYKQKIMNQLVKKLTKLKENQAKLKSYPAKERGVRFEEVFGEKIYNIKKKEKELVDEIV